MHIAISGGILHHPQEHRQRLQPTTETMLVDGLRERGYRVTEVGPRDVGAVATLRRQGIDIFHVHHPGRVGTVLGLGPHPVPIVYTPHRTNNPPKRILTIGHQALLRRAESVVALSPAERALLIRRGVEERRLRIIPNGFNSAIFETPDTLRRRPAAGGRWRLLYVGQLIPAKQPGVILEAIDDWRLRDRVEVRYVFHRDPLLPDLKAEVMRRRLSHAVSFVGQRWGDALADEYRRAHFLLLPSHTLEALPSVITEAVFTGLPVIAGDVGGVRWQLSNFGSCVESIDGVKLRSTLLSDMERYEELAAAGVQSAVDFRARFSVSSMLDGHERLYQDLFDSGREMGSGVE